MAESETVGQRFTQLISHLGISKNAFAASLDKTATVVQHLVDERNKPGFDLLCKVFEVYPNISKSWLLQGEGPMLTDADVAPAPVSPAPAAKPMPPASVTRAQVAPPEPQESKPKTTAEATETPVAPLAAEAVGLPKEPVPAEPAAQIAAFNPLVATPAAPAGESWQTALYTQQMAHQLAMAELRNQHLQEQQRLMQQMLDLMQRQLAR